MTRFIEVLQGLPASGKSTYARKKVDENPHQHIRVNKDDLRKMLHNSFHCGSNEKLIIQIESSIIEKALTENRSVIVDSTNLNSSHVDRIKNIAVKFPKVQFKVTFLDVSLDECLLRNQNREDKVPEDVIRGMWGKYLYVKDFVPSTSNKKVELTEYILVDVDGTLADCSHREHYVSTEGKKDWNMFFNLTPFDPARQDVLDLIETKYKNLPKIIVTARDESWRPHTEKWLKEAGVTFENILMRQKNDKRKDTEVKQEILDMYCNIDRIKAVVDDRPCVVSMWKDNGLFVEDVGQERWAGRE